MTNNNNSGAGVSVIRAVIQECEEKLMDGLCCSDKVGFYTDYLFSQNFLNKDERKSIKSGKTKVIQCERFLKILQESRNDEILDAIIKYLRDEDQDHLFTLLEYSRVKHKRIRLQSESQHM